MTLPLLALAFVSVVGGFMGIGGILAGQLGELDHHHGLIAAATSVMAVAVGLWLAVKYYREAPSDPLPEAFKVLAAAARNRFFVDEFYERTVIRFQDATAALVGWLDRWVVAGLLVRGTQVATELAGRSLRMLQTGNLQTYAFLFVLGAVLLLYTMIAR